MKKIILLFFALSGNFYAFAQKKSTTLNKLEDKVQQTIAKTYPASVRISQYDAVNARAGGGTFSGVVVDTAGHILSVAHAVKPQALYEITFPDGKKLLARGLGAMPTSDAAMLKITTKGSWPYAPMGWSSSLQRDMPCISISYPYLAAPATPNIRFGYIGDLETGGGFLRSTCLMEPGDSGGPLFDMQGRVIALHSKIDMSLDANFEVPIDLYRKYWSALTVAKSYAQLPGKERIATDPEVNNLKILPEMKDLTQLLSKSVTSKLAQTTVKIISAGKRKGVISSAFGALFNVDSYGNQRFKDKGFVVSKSSLVGDSVSVEWAPNKLTKAKVISRDMTTDLVLLEIDLKTKKGIHLNKVSEHQLKTAHLGKLLVSPRLHEQPLLSVLSNTTASIAKTESNAHIGLGVRLINGKLSVITVYPGGPASRASIFEGDILLSVNGKPINKETDFSDEIESYLTNDTAVFQVLRDGVQFDRKIAVRLASISSEMHIAYQFADGRSGRRGDFRNVIVHDGRLKPVECGGPLYGIDGIFYGINIARFSRTSTLAIPASAVRKFIEAAFLPAPVSTALNIN